MEPFNGGGCSLVIRMPCKYSHTTLGGLQSDSICVSCQHRHNEVSRTIYLGGSWWFVRMVHSALVPVLEQDHVTQRSTVVHHLSVELPQPVRPVCTTASSLLGFIPGRLCETQINWTCGPAVQAYSHLLGQKVEMETFQKEPRSVTNSPASKDILLIPIFVC